MNRIPVGMLGPVPDDLPTIETLDDLTRLVTQPPPGEELYVRWSQGPAVDVPGRCGGSSRDTLTGIALPGLSANPLAVEAWWGDRSPRLWAARRLYDYRHLHKPGVRPWVLAGVARGRGPDNEPLVRCLRPVAWIAGGALDEAEALVEAQPAEAWGPLARG
ncbi:DUF6098 family protein [Actinoplanes sp. URMC 104]|uniref:DUF6098 family protein n=1 Tax=Actinoplanes sp. URMC 104 TaxID=3423409 RepID=UPI003F1BFF1D